MKKIFKILGLLILLVIVIGAFVLQDNKKDFVAYQNYAESLESFETDYGTMKYSDVGEGQVIVLIHGVPTSSWMYRNVSQELVKNGYRVIAPDLMGFGASDRMAQYDMYDFQNQSDILFDLMESLNINSWEQVTHDMGGLVTWHMAKDQPEKIAHLYILNTILYKDTFNPPVDFSYENSLHKWFLGLHAHSYIGKLIINNMITTGTHHFDAPSSMRAGYWLPVRKGAGALVHFFTHTAEVKENLDTYRSWLVDSDISVSVLWGEHDPFLDISSARLIQEEMSLNDSDVVILRDTKHLVAEEAYQEIAEFIINKKYE